MMKMTKKLIILMLVVLGWTGAEAQVKFGVKAGLDLTNFWGKRVQERKLLLNYQAGLLMEYKFNPRFGIGPEVVFAAQGGQWEAYDGNPDRYHTNYINVPVMLKYYAATDLSIDFGPQLGFNVYSKSSCRGKVYNHKDWTNTLDFGIGLGATCYLDEHAFMQARYTLGLTRVFNSFGEKDNRKNGNIQLTFGVLF